MVRSLRVDYPGAWQHLGNRGIGKRTVFEGAGDVGVYLDLLGWVRKRGLLEVHAYAFLTTHFHLLVRSPTGNLSLAMKWVEQEYVRYFNRRRNRDGPLFRSRYWNRVVDSAPYWEIVLRYIDRNPVQAGLASSSLDYPFGSAWWYARGGGPACLDRSIVDRFLGLGSEGKSYPEERKGRGGDHVEEMVRRRSRGPFDVPDPLTDLVRAGAGTVQEWLRSRTRLADGTEPGRMVVSADSLAAAAEEDPGQDVDSLLLPAMVRLFGGWTLEEVGARFSMSAFTVRRRTRAHVQRISEDEEYLGRAAAILMGALARERPMWGDPQVLPFLVPALQGKADQKFVSDTDR